jgi:hypothetical protein
LRISDIALLFYPYEPAREVAFLLQMKAAIEAKELLSTPMKPDGVMPCDLAAWPNCPPVPLNSPLRFWLPEWMRAAQPTDEPEPPQAATEPAAAPEKPAGAADWDVRTPKRFQSYNEALHAVVKQAKEAGQPTPTARDVLAAWRALPVLPHGICKVFADSFSYYDAKGNEKNASLDALQKTINRSVIKKI